MAVFAIFSCIGALDWFLGNRWGLGERFEEGFLTAGRLLFAMAGIYTVAPWLAGHLDQLMGPAFAAIGWEPSLVTSSFLAIDMGGYTAARAMAESNAMLAFSGIVVAASLGATLSFSIPIGLGMIDKKTYPAFFRGTILGLIALPIGFFAGGLVLGLEAGIVMWQLVPTGAFAILLALGLSRAPEGTERLLHGLARGLQAIGAFGLALIVLDELMGITILRGLVPFSEISLVVGRIALLLSGALPLMATVTWALGKGIDRIGKLLGVGELAVLGLAGALVNNMIAYARFDQMDQDGQVLVSGICVSSAFVIGGQLGFVQSLQPEATLAFIASKLVAGIFVFVLYRLQKSAKLRKSV